ncbi:transcription initiation factor IIB [Tieghemostelium lacteum]|uniref:Transcription initiation factor IIB n=1 Tax=Tieghemostelium lacteum TaxID=361077 RepID=A0A152A9B4_TIELA|nr:transcription initiation factor IIB [Tieghemostelium lacteum]|eukprot:KYR02804.1 transcription initiation factor IIB [Tieghemostelium lacteum]
MIHAPAVGSNNAGGASTSNNEIIKKKYGLLIKLTCPVCKNNDPDIVEDYAKGDLICRGCGVVLGDRIIDEHSEWRTFSNSESTGADPNRVGGPTNPLLREAALSTTIGKGAKDTGSLSKLQNRNALGSGDRNLLAAFSEIGRMVDRLGLPQTIHDKANELYRMMDDRKPLRGKSADGMMAAALYMACRIDGTTRQFKEIAILTSNVTKVDISRCYKTMKDSLSDYISLQTITSEDFITRYCSELKLPLDVKKSAEHVSKTAQDMGIVSGKSPISVTAASIYMVSQCSTEKRSQKEISNISGISEVTIKNTYKDLYNHRESLFPANSPFISKISSLPSP